MSKEPRTFTTSEAAAFPWYHEAEGLDISFDCVGIPEVAHRAMEVTRTLVSLFAVQREAYTFPNHAWGRLTLMGSGPMNREAAQYAADRLADGRLDFAPLVTETMPLGDYGKAVEMLKKQEATKVAFLPQES